MALINIHTFLSSWTSCTARRNKKSSSNTAVMKTFHCCLNITSKMKSRSCYPLVKGKEILLQPGVAQRVGRGIALLFHDHGTRRQWVVSSTPRPHFNPGKDPVPILQEDGWAPGPVWTGRKSRPHQDSIPDRPAHSQSLYRLSYPAHMLSLGTFCNLE